MDVSKEKNNQEERVDASEISFHIVTLKPSHPEQLNTSVWKEKKYQVKNLPYTYFHFYCFHRPLPRTDHLRL